MSHRTSPQRSKQSSLSKTLGKLHTEQHQQNKLIRTSGSSIIKTDQPKLPNHYMVSMPNANLTLYSKSRSRSRKREQFSPPKATNNSLECDVDEQKLLQECLKLSSEVETLKQAKYHHIIQLYKQKSYKEAQKKEQERKKLIQEKFQSKKLELNQLYLAEKIKYQKQLEEFEKHKNTYQLILEALEDRRKTLSQEHQESIAKCNKAKELTALEWKKLSEAQINKAMSSLQL